jgi:tripartite-type tricarboxylate transporter receptor subunit TctC
MRWLCVLLVVMVEMAWAQYPARPVRMVVGFPPGGGTDIIARLVAQKLGERWGQPVVVENKLGASGNIGAESVAKSAPDGYTLLMAFSSHASNAALSRLPFDIHQDFSAITLVGSAPMVITANPALPAKTLADLIAYAKANPGAIKYGSSGIGTPVHLAGDDGNPRRRHPAHLRRGALRVVAFQKREIAPIGGREREPLSGAARGADHGGSRTSRL